MHSFKGVACLITLSVSYTSTEAEPGWPFNTAAPDFQPWPGWRTKPNRETSLRVQNLRTPTPPWTGGSTLGKSQGKLTLDVQPEGRSMVREFFVKPQSIDHLAFHSAQSSSQAGISWWLKHVDASTLTARARAYDLWAPHPGSPV